MTKPPVELVAFHGSGVAIDVFDYQFTNQGNDQNGSGFYFTTDLEEAIRYCNALYQNQPKLGGDDNPTVHVVRLTFENVLDCKDERALTAAAVKKIILASPVLDDALTNFGDVEFEGKVAVLNEAVQLYVTRKGDTPVIKELHKLANDFFPDAKHTEAFNRAVFKATGIDAVKEEYGNRTHYVAFFPEQVEILAHVPRAELSGSPQDNLAQIEEKISKRSARRPKC